MAIVSSIDTKPSGQLRVDNDLVRTGETRERVESRRLAALNLRNFDLNLLVIFQAIARQGSVIGAAEQVGLSPSAVSHALARLRTMFKDELFYRSSNGLHPTQRASDICKEITVGLAHIANALETQNSFVPSVDDRRFTIQIAEYAEELLVPPLVAYARRHAPGISIQILPLPPNAPGGLESVDLEIRPPCDDADMPYTRSHQLADAPFVVVMKHAHPLCRSVMTPTLLASLDHVTVARASYCTRVIDDALARRNLSRRVVMSVPSWHALPDIIESTDLVAVIPGGRTFASERFERFAMQPLPFDEVTFPLSLYWDSRRDLDPGNRWLRRVIMQMFTQDRRAGLDQTRVPSSDRLLLRSNNANVTVA